MNKYCTLLFFLLFSVSAALAVNLTTKQMENEKTSIRKTLVSETSDIPHEFSQVVSSNLEVVRNSSINNKQNTAYVNIATVIIIAGVVLCNIKKENK